MESAPPASPAPRSESGCRTAGGLLLAAGGILLLLGALALFFAVDRGRELVDSIDLPGPGLLSAPTPTPVIVSPKVILQHLSGASELMTSIAAVETIVDARQDRTLGPFTVGTTRLLYIANGEVRAGVDL